MDVEIAEQVATTTMDITLENPSSSRLEARMVVPVPEESALRGFTYDGAGPEPTAEILPKTEARRIYDQIVARTRDPALLEFIGYNLIQSSVFPVEARSELKVRIVYNEFVESFAPETVIKTESTMREVREYLRGIRVRGGTNIHDALQEALRMRAREGFLPLVLFLTDGLPTIGQTSERAIREIAVKGNRHNRRIFTFGVGVDVNTPLLDKIAIETRGTSTFVLPKEDVEVKVAQVFKRLSGPVLVEPELRVVRRDAGLSRPRVRDVLPGRLPDLFEGDQLVVLRQYMGENPLAFELIGDYAGNRRSFDIRFELAKATTRNAFVARLWASRKIAFLTDAIRDLGAQGGATFSPGTATDDPRLKELVDEIVRLSKEFGVLSEYTAFLAREGTDLSLSASVLSEATKNFDDRALRTRTGIAGVNQEFNNKAQRAEAKLNSRNSFLDKDLNRVEISTVQQVNDKAFYKRGNRWVEAALIDQRSPRTGREVQIGSPEFRDLVDLLAKKNRQGIIALEGEILLQIDGETILVK